MQVVKRLLASETDVVRTPLSAGRRRWARARYWALQPASQARSPRRVELSSLSNGLLILSLDPISARVRPRCVPSAPAARSPSVLEERHSSVHVRREARGPLPCFFCAGLCRPVGLDLTRTQDGAVGPLDQAWVVDEVSRLHLHKTVGPSPILRGMLGAWLWSLGSWQVVSRSQVEQRRGGAVS